MRELVEINNLTKVYEKKKVALEHLNLVIPRERSSVFWGRTEAARRL